MSQYTDTLAGLLLLNDANNADIDVTDLLQDAPLVAAITAVPASQGGTVHKYNKEVLAPGVGFRAIGQGLANAAGKIEQVSINCKLLDASFDRDVAAAQGYRGGVSGYMAKEGRRSLQAAFFALEKQIINGLGANAAGYEGLADVVPDAMVINAGGNGGKSVYLIRSSEDDVALVAGNDGRMDIVFDESSIVRSTDSEGNPFSAFRATQQGWFALQPGSVFTIARIVNLDGTSGKTLTDAMIAQAIALFPANRRPTHVIMNRTSQEELRASRTATNPTGQPAPFPDSVYGYPIVVTDALADDESQWAPES